MTPRAGRGRVPVMPEHRIHLALELVEDADPITGRIVSSDGEDHPFRGWLELAVALDEVRGAPADAHPND